MKKLLVVRIRGTVMQKSTDKTTLELLKLPKRHSCSLINDTPSTRAMLKTVDHLVTWGEADEASVKEITELKKAQKTKKGTVYLSLAPPKGGFERKGIKRPFAKGGAAGYRGDKIGALVKKML